MTPPQVSVIIPHRNDLDGLERCLAALSALQHRPHEIIIADNASTTDAGALEALIQRHLTLPVKLVHERRPGAAHARNAAVHAASGSLLAFLDCDCSPQADWMGRGCDLLAIHAVAGGPVVVSWDASDGPVTPAVAFDLLFGFNVARSYRRNQHLLTSNMWVRRDVFDAVGPFRGGVSEDVDWCHRATAKGFRLAFDPGLSVSHRALPERAQLQARWRRITRETWLYESARGRGGVRWFARCLAVAASIPVHGMRVFFDGRLAGTRLRIGTFALLADIRLRRAIDGLGLLLFDPASASGKNGGKSAETVLPPKPEVPQGLPWD